MNINDVYTPLEQAKRELQARQNDSELKRKVAEFIGADMPVFLKAQPRAILSRGILTPNFETKYFLDILDLIELEPVCAEFHSDRFCSQNKDKVHLGKLTFFHKFNKKGENIITRKTIIDFKNSENKAFHEIQTMKDSDFIEFHHSLFVRQYKKILDIFDISIFKNDENTAKEVYEKIFALCLVNGILFENFIMKDHENEKKFSEHVVFPAFESVVKKFNLRPLVVPLLPLKNEEIEMWNWYPGHLEKEVITLLEDFQ